MTFKCSQKNLIEEEIRKKCRSLRIYEIDRDWM